MAYSKEHYLLNKEAYAIKSKAWREANPERTKENRKRNYELNKEKNIEYSTWYNRKRKLGITKEEYTNLLKLQEEVCAICGKQDSKSLACDHNHTTGKIRGLLCSNCNRGLGYLQDSSILLTRAISYLEKHNDTNSIH